PADVNQPVDRARPAQHLAARPWQAASVELGLRLGLELPGDLRVVDIAVEAGRDVDPRVAVLAAGFEQQYLVHRVRRQPVGEHAAGRSGTDDDVIVFGFAQHRYAAPRALRKSATTSSRVRVCQRRRRPIGSFSISGTTLQATKTGPGAPMISGRARSKSPISVKA